nr:MAG TPA: hypothetical protein [Caudoviricetes sp.]
MICSLITIGSLASGGSSRFRNSRTYTHSVECLYSIFRMRQSFSSR